MLSRISVWLILPRTTKLQAVYSWSFTSNSDCGLILHNLGALNRIKKTIKMWFTTRKASHPEKGRHTYTMDAEVILLYYYRALKLTQLVFSHFWTRTKTLVYFAQILTYRLWHCCRCFNEDEWNFACGAHSKKNYTYSTFYYRHQPQRDCFFC